MRHTKRFTFATAGLGITVLMLGWALPGLTATPAADGGRGAAHGSPTAEVKPADHRSAALQKAYAAIPLAFVENRRQTDPRVKYYAVGDHYAFFATRDELMLSLTKDKQAQELALALRFRNHSPDVTVTGTNRVPGTVNYLGNKHPARSQTGLSRYGQIAYHDLWPDIDLLVYESAGVLKYEFRVRPGGRVSDIRLAYAGAKGLALGAAGALRIQTGVGVLRDTAPVSYQTITGRQVPVSSRYLLEAGGKSKAPQFAFDVGSYQRDHELVIDPGVQFTTFLGGNSAETGAGIAVDGSGNSYIAGTTQSPNFPTTTGAFKRTGATNNFADAFVTKLNPAGTALVYSTFVGGSNMEFANGVAIDGSGNAYVTGTTKSSNFPTTGGAFDRSINIPPNCPRCGTDVTDGFVFKLNAAGSALAYSTYLGGTEDDSPRGIAVAGGNAFVTGETLSSNYPTTAGAFDRTYAGQYDMFVTKLNTAGSALAYSTFLGGAAVDNGAGVAVDSGGNAYAIGFTSSTGFPTTAGAFDRTQNGGFDGTLTKLNPAGSALVYSTYLGGAGSDGGSDLAVDSGGNAYVAGGTGSTNFPTTAGAFDTTSDGNDAFVTKFNATGSGLVYSTVFGGTDSDSAGGIVLDPAGNAWLAGGTTSTNFPVSADAADQTFNGAGDAIVAKLNASGSALPYATYLGGSQSEGARDIGRDSAGNLYVTGLTYSMDFPVTVGAFDTIWNGDLSIFWGDAFVTKVSLTGGNTPPADPPVPVAPTLLAPANAAHPQQPIGFDWTDVAGAASYTIQIDNSSGFTAPLTRQASVTASFFSAGGLPTTTQFWRVRGVNTAGTPGVWSAVRSFQAQAAPPPTTLTNLDINPTTVVGSDLSSGTVIVSEAAPDTTVISLSSSNPAVASVPASVTVPTGGFSGTFLISTAAVTTTTTVVITASYNGTSRTGTLTVTPN